MFSGLVGLAMEGIGGLAHSKIASHIKGWFSGKKKKLRAEVRKLREEKKEWELRKDIARKQAKQTLYTALGQAKAGEVRGHAFAHVLHEIEKYWYVLAIPVVGLIMFMLLRKKKVRTVRRKRKKSTAKKTTSRTHSSSSNTSSGYSFRRSGGKLHAYKNGQRISPRDLPKKQFAEFMRRAKAYKKK